MKKPVCRLFVDPRRAEGTVRELVLMAIRASDILITPVRARESRSFAASAQNSAERGVVVCATVDLEDVDRVEATLVRNRGLAPPENRASSDTGRKGGLSSVG
jgi:hypothetical protein